MATNTHLGCRLIVALIDQYAASDPSPVWAVVPIDEGDLSKGFREITYREFANAINTAAAWLQDHLPFPERDFETIAYSGPKDIRYQIVAVAAAKLRLQVRTSTVFLILQPLILEAPVAFAICLY
jgi:acyl-CoA synthetase (AMP-forming)/AMP-acid ligase II